MSTKRSAPSKTPSAATTSARGTNAYTTVVKRSERNANTSQQVNYEDAFLQLAGGVGGVIPLVPPYTPEYLYSLISVSNTLGQAISAFIDNTVGTGWESSPLVRGREMRTEEESLLTSFITDANSEQSLDAVVAEVVRDRESVGYGFMEIIRDNDGYPVLARHAPALFTRLCPIHPDEIQVIYDVPRGARLMPVIEYRRFRRFVQQVGMRFIYFKEYGDPRVMNRATGLFAEDPGYVPGQEATEIWHWPLPSTEPYGKPRWINQMPNILGVRESEEGNMRFFEDNTVPPVMVTVSGGRLTSESARALTSMMQAEGVDKQNRMVLIEAVGEGADVGENSASIQVKVEKLTDARQSDALFSKYDMDGTAKILSSWRMTPSAIGRIENARYLDKEMQFMETAVFAPERAKIDELLNKGLVNSRRGLRLASVRLNSRTPAISSPDQFIRALTALNVIGAVTPRSAQTAANKALQIEVTQYPASGEPGYEDWMDEPIIMARNRTQDTPNDAAGSDPGGSPLANGGTSAMPGKKHKEQAQKPGFIKAIENNTDTATTGENS